MVSVDPLDCTVVGDVFLDIITEYTMDSLRLAVGGTSYCQNVETVLGGSANVAVGLSLLGGKAAFIGKAGKDYLGNLYLQDLKEAGVIPKVFFERDSPTGLIIVFVEDKRERSFLIFRGANDKLTAREVEEAKEIIQRSKYVYVSGYSLVSNPQRSAIMKAIELAKEFKAKIVFDPGAHNLIKLHPRLFGKILDLCDIFSPNLAEAEAITNTADIEGMIEVLRYKVPLTALKCGERGSVIIMGEETLRIPAVRVKCLDPTGAGDAFTAALIYGLAKGMPLETTGRLANYFGAQLATKVGSRGFPAKSKIDWFLQNVNRHRTKD